MPFLDVLVERKVGLFITRIYCNATFPCLHTTWNSFVPKFLKVNLISTLVHHVWMNCSFCTFNQELEKIRCIFIDSAFPINVMKRAIERKIKRFKEPVVFGPSPRPVYLKLP